MNHKLRISYSLLNLWSAGKQNDALTYYFKLPTEKKPWEARGIEFHKEWENTIIQQRRLPDVLGGDKLKYPKPELKLELDGSVLGHDWFTLVGIIDCLDEPCIYEFKSGITPIGRYETSHQGGIYAILAEHNGYNVDRIWLKHYNQEEENKEQSLIWVTPERKEKALNFILTIGSEIYEHFNMNNLWEFGGGYGQVDTEESLEEESMGTVF